MINTSFTFILLFITHVLTIENFIVPPVMVPKALYADWAHKHWAWINGNNQNQTLLLQLLDDYLMRDIPVGAINVDSAWSTGINNFVWDTKKFPNATDMIAKIHSKGAKVVCWATSVIDTDSPNYKEGYDKKYYLSGGRTVKWWHGHGSFIDYTYPEAVDWWHKQLDLALDTGIDGWKTDGTDPFVFELIVPWGHKGYVSEREYANLYYSDFFYYTRKKRGDEALIMSRPVDSIYHIYFSFSPRDVVFSGWVGDQDPTFDGLKQALQNMFHSAYRGYVGFGSDIGGYKGGNGSVPLGRTRELFIRWAQLGAFCSLMENGGGNEHRPWIFDQYFKTGNETTEIYRKFVHAHHELIPYLMSAGVDAWNGNHSIMKPLAEETIWTPSTWDYLLGKDILVSPIVDNSLKKTIQFPSGNDWVDYWNSSVVYQGGSKIDYYCPLSSFPVFKRAGSIIPLEVTRSYVGHGDESSTGYITLLLEHPREKGHTKVSRFVQEEGFEATYLLDKSIHSMIISVSAQPKPLIVLIRGLKIIKNEFSIRIAEKVAYQVRENEIKIRVDNATRGIEIRITGIQSYI